MMLQNNNNDNTMIIVDRTTNKKVFGKHDLFVKVNEQGDRYKEFSSIKVDGKERPDIVEFHVMDNYAKSINEDNSQQMYDIMTTVEIPKQDANIK